MSESSATQASDVRKPGSGVEKPVKKRKKATQERVMLYMIGIFLVGIFLYSITPPDTAIRDAAVVGYIGAMMFGFFRAISA